LPGASAWIFREGKVINKYKYFHKSDWENQPKLEKEKFYDKLKETFKKILPRYFNENNSIAMSLTSGLDTRLIMSYIDNNIYSLPCYTFTGLNYYLKDAIIAHRVANTCKKTHKVIPLEKNFFLSFQNLAEKAVYITDGYIDISGSYDIIFNQIARNIAKIRMTGKFGSEMLGNLSMLKNAVKFSKKLFHPDIEMFYNHAVSKLKELKNGNELTFSVFKETPWFQYGRLYLEMSKLIIRTPYMDNDLIKTIYQGPKDIRSSNEIRIRLIEDGNAALRKIMTDRGTAGKTNYFISKIAQFYYFTLFKGEYIYLYDLPHFLAKLDCNLKFLHPERLFAGRYQLAQWRLWFREELSEYLKNILFDKRTLTRPYFNKKFIEKMVMEHCSGKANYVNEIRQAIKIELIQRLLIEDM
jgi:asparagine synthase (glutamine-hydrolysing)